MSVLSEVAKIYNMDPVKTSTPVASASKQPREQINNDSNHYVRSTGKGDFSCLEAKGGINAPPNPPPTAVSSCASFRNTPSRSMSSSLQRVKSQIVELFSRGNPSRSGSIRKMSKSKKKTELQTIFGSCGSSSSGNPQLLGANRKSSIPMLRESTTIKNSDSHYQGNGHSSEHAAVNIANQELDSPLQNERRQLRKSHINASTAVNPPTSFRMCSMSSKCGANFGTSANEEGVDSTILPSVGEETVGQANMKLQQENLQLWEDNRTLATALDDAQVKLEYLQKRNKYLEVAMYQEGQVLADIIRECHEEIERLKQTQCELLSGDINQALLNVRLEKATPSSESEQQSQGKNFDSEIRQYYIQKYAASNGVGKGE